MKKWGWLVMLSLISTFVIWLPFLLRLTSLPLWGLDFGGGMETVFANFDGPNYLIVAKTWYDKSLIRQAFSNPLLLEYYPAHFPLYPALIALFDLVLPGTWAMLGVTVLGTALAAVMFYKLLVDFRLAKKPVWLAIIVLFLPARWLVVRSVGSPEPWFIFFVLASVWAFKKKRYWWAGIWGALAQLTKSPGILLFAGYGVYWLYQGFRGKKWRWRCWPVVLIPAVIPLIFWFYARQTGDFWAYFHSGDNFHLFLPPFSVFSPQGQFWVNEFWLEENIWIWGVYGLGVINLWRKKLPILASFASVFLVSTLFVAHRDIARYILPIAPLAAVGWEKILTRVEYRWWFGLLLVPIYLYAWNFMLHNTAPVADWGPYL